jgi:hypothetical protein
MEIEWEGEREGGVGVANLFMEYTSAGSNQQGRLINVYAS